MRNKIIISVNLILIAVLSGLLLNFDIDIGKSDGNHQKALTLGFKDSLTITIGLAGQAYAASPDYTCDGTADDVQFQAALNALPASGGKLTVLTGQYNFASTVTRAIGNVVIEGNGYSTYLVYNGALPVFTAGGSNWVFQDIRFDAGFVTTNTDTQVLRCWDGATYYAAYTNSGADNWNIPTGRGATVIVAANDSSDIAKAQADYLCDGVADNVQIQAAIDYIESDALGGIISLAEGTYNNSSGLTINPGSCSGSIKLVGYGATINHTGADIGIIVGTNIISSDAKQQRNATLEGFSLIGTAAGAGGIKLDSTNFNILRNIYIQDYDTASAYGILHHATASTWSEGNIIEKVTVKNCYYGLYSDTPSGRSMSDTRILYFQARNVPTSGKGIYYASQGIYNGSIISPVVQSGSGSDNVDCYDFGSGRWSGTTIYNPKVEVFGSGYAAVTCFNSDQYIINIESPRVIGNYTDIYNVETRFNFTGMGETADVSTYNFGQWNGVSQSGMTKTRRQVIDHADITRTGTLVGHVDFDETVYGDSKILSVNRDITTAFKDTVGGNSFVKVMIGESGDLDRFDQTADPGDNIWNSTTDAQWDSADFQGVVTIPSNKTLRVTFTVDSEINDLISGAGSQGTLVMYVTYRRL